MTQFQLPLSELTAAGMQAFRRVISNAPQLSIPELERRLAAIAGDSATSVIVDNGVRVPLSPALDTRHDTAVLVNRILRDAAIEASPTQTRERVFAWLAAMFLPALCKRTKAGHAATGKLYRYIPTRSSRDFYRHLVACPYWLYRKHGEHARIFLAQQAFIMPDVVEQIASRPALIESPAVAEVIDRLYWDPVAGEPKTGFTVTERVDSPQPGFAKTMPGPGTLRALESLLGNLQCTFDLRSMTADQILAKLPAEFSPWLGSAASGRSEEPSVVS